MDLPKPAPTGGGNGSGIGSDAYLKIGAGEEIDVVFRGSPYLFYLLWPQGGEKQIFNEPVPGAKPRYLWNAVVYDLKAKKLVAKVWEMAAPTYELLFKINSKMPIETTKIQISRTGTGKNTRYQVIPLGPVDAKALKAIEAVELNILHREASAESAQAETEAADDAEEAPF